ncbi:uncharacterized protein [Eurosta solidaginis]|uniref:uncharacterized protein n=1 Tax=Eurosta solidaginis TaxID=178769 RepID=UPI003531088F
MEDMEKERKDSLKEASNLLKLWKLESLCKKFEEQEVCTEAFRHLTDSDITDLIPKIGPRSIFRFHLNAWRQQQDLKKTHPMVMLNRGIADTTTVSIKSELPEVSTEELIGSQKALVASQSRESISSPKESLANAEVLIVENQWEVVMKEDEMLDDSDSRAASATSGSKCDNYDADPKPDLDLHSVLSSSFEGVSALEYYKENNGLDMHHRKKVVKLVIAAALDKRLGMSVHDFHSMTTQLLKIFPKENYDIYYIPRVGTTRARGMLYNKYVNLARTWRKEGILEYRRSCGSKGNLQ